MAAAEHAGREWVERIHEWLYDLPAGTRVDADAVRHHFGTSAAMGSIFATARRRGELVRVGVGESTAPSRHRGLRSEWVRT